MYTIFSSCDNGVRCMLYLTELVGWFTLKPACNNQEILLETHLADPFPNFSILKNLETTRVHVLFSITKVTVTRYPVTAQKSSESTDFAFIDTTKKAY